MTVKELAIAKCKPLQSSNPKNRARSMARFFGYQQGALDALKEIETRIEMGRHASMQTAENIFDWWISGKSYKKWYAEKFLQMKLEFKDK